MTRVCVEWSRPETARLIARCREALDRGALSVVLDGIAATLSQDYQSRARDVEHALASLTAIAAALGVQEEAS